MAEGIWTDEWTTHPDLADEGSIHRGGAAEAVWLRERPCLAMVDLRADPDTVPQLEEALRLPVPRTPGASGDAHRCVLWLGPDWWLVVGPPGTQDDTATSLRAALGADHGSVVDVSAQRTALELVGPRARDVLMTGCSIDLHPRAFPAGSCAQTLLARAQVVLHHLDGDPETGADIPAYRILVRASYVAYLTDWLRDAMVEHTDASSG